MAQPKTAPLSIRPGSTRLTEIDAWATDHGLARHAAILALVDLGLRGPVSVALKARPAPKVAAPSVPVMGTFERKPYQKKAR